MDPTPRNHPNSTDSPHSDGGCLCAHTRVLRESGSRFRAGSRPDDQQARRKRLARSRAVARGCADGQERGPKASAGVGHCRRALARRTPQPRRPPARHRQGQAARPAEGRQGDAEARRAGRHGPGRLPRDRVRGRRQASEGEQRTQQLPHGGGDRRAGRALRRGRRQGTLPPSPPAGNHAGAGTHRHAGPHRHPDAHPGPPAAPRPVPEAAAPARRRPRRRRAGLLDRRSRPASPAAQASSTRAPTRSRRRSTRARSSRSGSPCCAGAC